jgi:rare lipoprotein A
VRVAPPPPVESSPLPAPPPIAVAAAPVPDGKVTVVQVPAVTSIYVQAGAYASLDDANRVVVRLKSVGARISQTNKEGRPLYRVRVGPFQNVNQADAALTQVQALGQNDVAIVVD